MDLRDTIIPKSDQLNAEDLIGGPMDVRVADIRRGSAEQPVELHLEGIPGRPFKPCKSVRRLLIACWGYDGVSWVGRRMRLYCDDSVEWGGRKVGGIRVSHLSHIDRPRTVLLSVKRGRRKPVTVEPLGVQESFSLADALEARGITIEQLDAWALEKDRPAVSSLDEAGKAKAGAWLASSQADVAVAQIKGAAG